jgi:alpha-tubulin suppressor-like RCC1 family protein
LLRSRLEKVECGYHHNAAIDEDNIAYTWGRSTYGQLGQAEAENQTLPSLLAFPLMNIEISEISCGWQHTLAVTITGFLYSWGLNMNGQLGLGDYTDRNVPTLVESVITKNVVRICAGHSHSAMTDDDAALFTWGSNPDCRLCHKITYYKISNSPSNFNRPTECIALKRQRIVDLSCGFNHSLFLRDDGWVYACGNITRGQIGDQFWHPEKSEDPFFAHYIFSTKGNKWVKAQAGDGFSVFLTDKGHVYTCGEANYGRLGHITGTSYTRPMMINYFRENNVFIVDIQVGGRHTYAISDKRELYVWGFGYYYQLANGNREDSFEPTKIALSKEVEEISCGYFHSAFIVGDDITIEKEDKS